MDIDYQKTGRAHLKRPLCCFWSLVVFQKKWQVTKSMCLWMDVWVIIKLPQSQKITIKQLLPLFGILLIYWPFGLCNTPSFQGAMIFVFLDLLHKSMMVFIDDFSTQFNTKDHLEYVEETLEWCKKMEIALNPNKIYLVVQKEILLDYVVSKERRKPHLEKIEVIIKMQPLTNVKEVERVLGHLRWY